MRNSIDPYVVWRYFIIIMLRLYAHDYGSIDLVVLTSSFSSSQSFPIDKYAISENIIEKTECKRIYIIQFKLYL
ncbi:MAG: hypothetical protein Hyperionvirus23_42 [Hyperionvirus sp.]|uniref:Uncharacterized protein n=1 Tax=Hyperionvirus sp. TaxID=2487770 RepID=A0A3G5AAW4_9VIRU|nr:MAG: hypothetical protein Hyperionvirus23_42 [Hyperionvirus sp.]